MHKSATKPRNVIISPLTLVVLFHFMLRYSSNPRDVPNGTFNLHTNSDFTFIHTTA